MISIFQGPDCIMNANIPIGQSRSPGQDQIKGVEKNTPFMEEASKSYCKGAVGWENR